MKTLFYFLILTLTLMGCTPQKVVEVRTDYIVVAPKPEYLEEIRIEPPPAIGVYEYLSSGDKEKTLMDWASALTVALGKVNRQLSSIRASVTSAQAIYGEGPGN